MCRQITWNVVLHMDKAQNLKTLIIPMKKILLYAVLISAGLAATSCDREDNYYSQSFPIPAYNLFTAKDGSGSAFVGYGNYVFTTEMPANTITMSTSTMVLPNGTTTTFSTDPLSYTTRYIKLGDNNCEEITMKSSAPVADMKISDLNCMLTKAAYNPGDIEVPGYKRVIPGWTYHFVVMQYTCNNLWNVRTFWPDMTFAGVTTTEYPGMTDHFRNEDMTYRIYMHRGSNNEIQDKADIIFYNARFAPTMPEITVVIKDLDLKFDNVGYVIEGSNIAPYMVEAGALQEAPRFTFNKFELSVSGDLTSAKADYTVAGVFKGSFNGSCIKR